MMDKDKAVEVLVEKSAEFLDLMRSGLETGGEFVLEQAPAIAREIVLYGRVLHPVYLIMYIAVFGGYAFWYFKNAKRMWSDFGGSEYENEIECGIKAIGGGIAAVIAVLISFISCFHHFHYAVLAWVAPRLYIIEYIGEVMK